MESKGDMGRGGREERCGGRSGGVERYGEEREGGEERRGGGRSGEGRERQGNMGRGGNGRCGERCGAVWCLFGVCACYALDALSWW